MISPAAWAAFVKNFETFIENLKAYVAAQKTKPMDPIPQNAQVIPSPLGSRIVADDVWASMTIWLEARGETYEGKLALAEVILNRRNAGHWGDTIAEVVLSPSQFSCWNTNGNRRSVAVLQNDEAQYQDCVRAWQAARAGSKTVHGATMYYNPAGVLQRPAWAKQELLLAVIGNHRFYAGG